MTATRRIFLQGLAALPVATIPVAASAMVVAHPDAALIEAARRTCALAALEERAVQRRAEAEELFESLEPAYPADCQGEISASMRAIMDECPNPVTIADNEILKAYMRRAQAAAAVIRDRHTEAMQTHDAECERLRRETGLERAERVSAWLTDRLQGAVDRLVAMPATTNVGLVAKAAAWRAIDAGSWGDCSAPWLDDLAHSVVNEVLAIGGGA